MENLIVAFLVIFGLNLWVLWGIWADQTEGKKIRLAQEQSAERSIEDLEKEKEFHEKLISEGRKEKRSILVIKQNFSELANEVEKFKELYGDAVLCEHRGVHSYVEKINIATDGFPSEYKVVTNYTCIMDVWHTLSLAEFNSRQAAAKDPAQT